MTTKAVKKMQSSKKVLEQNDGYKSKVNERNFINFSWIMFTV